MAGWTDLFSLLVTLSIFGGTVYGVVYLANQISEGIKSTKENLKTKGYDISNKGVSIKTSKRFDREDYVDATQRGMLKAMTATSFNRRADSMDGSAPSPNSNFSTPNTPASATSSAFGQRPATMERADSNASVKSSGSGEKKKRAFFGSKKSSL
ncbi:hypothetical protein P691DRAFT_759138 [Macrolepiota fuliginosa MF-IS2]|uniref:Uncharacterized protein n=1 Tax=Macrolepiota fuliginosa MF-IS2 TaxID=1400762 RepID=A0A9P5XDH1_9AGAR|nr:hypothetical protein P691DRAFT_759138 [Macrolepiota fuliginosa MF-IS2]